MVHSATQSINCTPSTMLSSMTSVDLDPALQDVSCFSSTYEQKVVIIAQNPEERPKKRVRFASQEQIFPTEQQQEQDDTELDQRWYSSTEYKQFRDTWKFCSKNVARWGKKDGQALHEVFEQCCSQDEGDDISSSSSSEPLSLPCFTNGLERMVNRTLFSDKTKRRSELVNLVLNLQEQQAFIKSSYAVQAQALRLVCQEITAPSGKFAQRIAA